MKYFLLNERSCGLAISVLLSHCREAKCKVIIFVKLENCKQLKTNGVEHNVP